MNAPIPPPTPGRPARPGRPRARVRRLGAAAVGVVVVLGACGSGDPQTTIRVEIEPRGGDEVEAVLGGETSIDDLPAEVLGAADDASVGAGDAADGRPADVSEADGVEAADEVEAAGEGSGLSPIAAAIVPAGRALDLGSLPEPSEGPLPVAIDLPSIGVEDAPIVPVGVLANGEMEIPGASDVGWYRHGPTPGEAGSSVLAAHIAFDGVDGVFRHLTDVEPGDRFAVRFDDGTSERFVVIGLRQWSKTDIPLEDLFARDGTPRLVLITCGGDFDPSRSSYDDNIVAIAVPLDFALGR